MRLGVVRGAEGRRPRGGSCVTQGRVNRAGIASIAIPVTLAGLLVGAASCSQENKCAPGPQIKASWAGQTNSLQICGGGLWPKMPTSSPSANMNGDSASIVMKVGQQLTITKGSGWTNFSATQPTSDDPTVLRVIQPAKRKVIGVFLAVKPGLADFGALSNACGSPIESSESSTGAAAPLLKLAAAVCMFGDVQVTP